MSDLVNAVVLSLAWFTAVNGWVSLMAWLVARRLPAVVSGSAGWLLAVRLLPAGASLLFVAAIFAPAHWRFEPRGGEESFGAVVHLLAAFGGALLARSAWRAACALRAAFGLRACDALPRVAAGDGVEIYEVAGLAGVSLAGIVRPRILVGPAVRETLTPEELQAAVAHEVAHRASRDNWKRLALYCAPDLFGHTAAAQQLEGRWSALAECQADARAVAGSRTRAADLASALLKVARLGARPRHSPAWSSLHDAPLLAERIHRLLGGHLSHPPQPAGVRTAGAWLAALAGLTAAGSLAAYDLHLLTETVAHFLP